MSYHPLPGCHGARHVEYAVAEELRELVELRGVVAAAEHLVRDQLCRLSASEVQFVAVPAKGSFALSRVHSTNFDSICYYGYSSNRGCAKSPKKLSD